MVSSVLGGSEHPVRTEIDYIPQQFFPASFLHLIAGGLLENLLKRSGAQTEDFNLVPDGGGFLEISLSEETL